MAVATPFLPEFPLFSPPGLYWAQSGSRRVTLPGVPSSGLSRAGNTTEERSGKGTLKASVNLQVGLWCLGFLSGGRLHHFTVGAPWRW